MACSDGGSRSRSNLSAAAWVVEVDIWFQSDGMYKLIVTRGPLITLAVSSFAAESIAWETGTDVC